MIINDKLVQSLANRLPNFYTDYSYDMDFIRELFDAYIAALGILHRHLRYTYNNTSIATAEVYKPLEKKPVVLKEALYDIVTISKSFGEATGKSWFHSDTTMSDKVTFLDQIGRYELLTDVNSADTNNEFILDFKIRKDFSGLLGYYTPFEDYVYKDYKLYLFNQLAKPKNNAQYKTVLFEDIKANDHKLDRQWGLFFPGIYSIFITKPEYKDMLKSLFRYDSSIAAINKVMQSINIPSNTVVRDKYSRKNIPTQLLNKFDKDLDPFDFVFKLPPEYIGALYYNLNDLRHMEGINPEHYDPRDLNYLYASLGDTQDTWVGRIIDIFNFIGLVKPEHTNFFLEGTMSIFDTHNSTDNLTLQSSVAIADSWLDESVYGAVTYNSSPYHGYREVDVVNLIAKYLVPEIYPDFVDYNTFKTKYNINELYDLSKNKPMVSMLVTLPTVTDQYNWGTASTTLKTTAEAVDTYDWTTKEDAAYDLVEYNVCTYGGDPIPRESTLLNLFSII